jgi:hypothetical protein
LVSRKTRPCESPRQWAEPSRREVPKRKEQKTVGTSDQSTVNGEKCLHFLNWLDLTGRVGVGWTGSASILLMILLARPSSISACLGIG